MKLTVESIIFTLLLNNLQAVDVNKWNWNVGKIKSIDAAVTKYYERKTFMMSISVYLEHSQPWQTYVQDYLTDALTDSKLMKYEIFMNPTGKSDQHKTYVSHNNLWYVDSFKAFCSLLQSVNEHHADKIGKFVVVIETAKSLNQKQEVKFILEKSFEMNIVDIVVAAYEGDSTFVLYSYDIFTPHRCRQAVVKQVNIFQNGSFQNDELFPYKFDNFHGCPLTTYIRNNSLFYRFNLTQDGKQIASIQGMEANMMQAMAAKLNFRLHMFYTQQDDSVGTVFENGSAVGPFRYLVENKLDILLGYYHYPVRRRYFGESTSYTFMPLVIVLSRFGKNEVPEVWPFKPFSVMTWLTFGLLCLLLMVLVEITRVYAHKTVTWIDVIGLALGNSRPIKLTMYMTKFSFVLCVFGIMILCATFQGRLYYAFNKDYIRKATTVEQLVQANYTFFITRRFDRDIIRSLNIPFEQIRFVDATDDYWIYETIHKYPNNAATFTNYWDFWMYVDAKKCYNDFDVLPLIVILNQICAYTRKFSYLSEPINRVINALKSSGILQKWLLDLTQLHRSSGRDSLVKHQLANRPLPLSVKKLKPIFTLLISLYLISILAFLCEVAASKWRKCFRSSRNPKTLHTQRKQTNMKN